MNFENISWKEAAERIDEPDTVLLDVREERFFRRRHIKGAVNCPYKRILSGEVVLPKEKGYIIYCERGNTSLVVADELHGRGYRVMNVLGGIQAFGK